MKKITNKGTLLIVLIVALLILLTPHLIRIIKYDSILLGKEPYYHIRMAEHLKNFDIPDNDPLIDRPYVLNPYHMVLAASSFIMPLELASKLVPFLLGILSAYLLFLIFNDLNLGKNKILIILLMFVTSPIFIFIFATSSQYSIIIFLNLLGFYLYMKKTTLFLWLSIIVFYLIPFFNIFNALITLILLFIYTIYSKMGIKKFYFISIGLFLRVVIYHFSIFYNYGLPQVSPFTIQDIIPASISDLGGLVSFGVFTLLLAAIGLFVTWKSEKEFYFIYPLAFFLFILSFFLGAYANIYQNFIVCILAGYGFFVLMTRKWHLEVIKNLTLLIIICGIIFSTTSYLVRLSNLSPNQEIIESLEWLNNNSNPSDIILSHHSNGYWIEAIAKRPVILDESFDYINFLDEKQEDLKEIFHSRTLKTTTNLLKKHNISYIWINKDMKEGLVWNKKEEGLLFLFRNSETFKKLKTYTSIEIWEFIG